MCNSPIIVDVEKDGFELTDSQEGVWFDLHGDGRLKLWAWTKANDDDSFLAMDRNGNGLIDDGTELFGSVCEQLPVASPEMANGFRGLAMFDQPERGGNADTVLDANDQEFSALRLWQDRNHNGLSEPEELMPLSNAGLQRLDLEYRESNRRDRHGNVYRYRSRAWVDAQPGGIVTLYDIFLTGGNDLAHGTSGSVFRKSCSTGRSWRVALD